jgi:hypothetical protein
MRAEYNTVRSFEISAPSPFRPPGIKSPFLADRFSILRFHLEKPDSGHPAPPQRKPTAQYHDAYPWERETVAGFGVINLPKIEAVQ